MNPKKALTELKQCKSLQLPTEHTIPLILKSGENVTMVHSCDILLRLFANPMKVAYIKDIYATSLPDGIVSQFSHTDLLHEIPLYFECDQKYSR